MVFTARKTLPLVFFFAIAGLVSQAQQPTLRDPLLDHLAGKWVLQGIIQDRPATHDITAEWVLGHQYLRIQEVDRAKDGSGEPAYQADVYVGWDQKLGQYACVWLDTYGGVSPVSIGNAKRDGDQIKFLFKDAESVFHTTFAFDAKSGTWEWRMDSEQAGKFNPFLRAKLTRKN